MSRTAVPSSCCRPASSSRICAWTVTSSAVVGSSAMSRAGRQASAMAIITRWRMPPDSSCGQAAAARRGVGDADEAEHRLGLRPGRGAAEPEVAAQRLGDLRRRSA